MKSRTRVLGTLSVIAAAWSCAPAHAQGDAPLFDSIDENFNPVSMADMIDGKPLVMAD